MRKLLVPGALFLFALCLNVSARAASLCSTAGNLVANCGFESGSFSNWTLSGNLEGGVNGNYIYIDTEPHSGDYNAAFGAQSAYGQTGSGNMYGPVTSLTQSLALLTNERYQVSFFLYSNGCSVSDPSCPGYHNYFDASLGGKQLIAQKDISQSSDYNLYTFTTSTGSMLGSNLLQFDFTNDDAVFLLDDVSVNDLGAAPVPTPEPSSLLLVCTGLGGMAGFARRRLRRS